MLVKLEDAVSLPFSTRDPSTGEAADADSLPTAVVEGLGLNIPGTDIAVVKKAGTTGQYNVTLTVSNVQFAKGLKYTVRVTATVGGVTDQAPIATFEAGVEALGNAVDATVSSRATVAGVWSFTDTESATKTAFQVICMAAAGAGAGTVDVSVPTGVTRNETTRYLDGSDAYVTVADENGNRTLVNLNP